MENEIKKFIVQYGKKGNKKFKSLCHTYLLIYHFICKVKISSIFHNGLHLWQISDLFGCLTDFCIIFASALHAGAADRYINMSRADITALRKQLIPKKHKGDIAN